MVSAPPRIIIATPIGSEIPPRCTGTCGCRCADNSRNHTLNLANTKPRLMTATLVLIQAKKVRSLARYSVARFVSSIVALCFCFCICRCLRMCEPLLGVMVTRHCAVDSCGKYRSHVRQIWRQQQNNDQPRQKQVANVSCE